MSTVYTNDLRLKEIGTALESPFAALGGTSINLSLIAVAFCFIKLLK